MDPAEFMALHTPLPQELYPAVSSEAYTIFRDFLPEDLVRLVFPATYVNVHLQPARDGSGEEDDDLVYDGVDPNNEEVECEDVRFLLLAVGFC